MRVLMMPDYRRDNPYQRLLAEALCKNAVAVSFPCGYRRVLPLWRAWRDAPQTAVLHLHWITPYLRGRNLLTQLLYCIRLLADVAMLRICGVGVVWTIHNRISHEAAHPRLERWTQRRLIKLVRRVIVHTRAGLEELRSDLHLRDEKVRIIPHGHYGDAYGPAIDTAAARRLLDLPAGGRVYLFFGFLRPYKGIERLIAAWQSFAKPAGAILLIAGKPLDDRFREQLLRSADGVDGIRIHANFISADRVPVFFSAADVVVLPFSSILTSGSVVLAMTYARPVIAPRFPALAETLGDATDLLYDIADAEGLRRSFEQSACIPLSPLRVKAQRACTRLDWARVAELTAQAYRNEA